MASNIIGSGGELSQLYLCDFPYSAGTVLKAGGNNPFELTICTAPYDTQAIGVVATNPGVMSNADAPMSSRNGGTYLPVTTNGRSYALVQGPAGPGDQLVPGYVAGTLMSLQQNPAGAIATNGVIPAPLAKCLDTVPAGQTLSVLVVVNANASSAPTGNLVVANETVTGTATINTVVTTNGVFWANGTALATGTYTTPQTFVGAPQNLAAIFNNQASVTTVANSSASGTVPFYVSTQSVLYYTGNASQNFTMNVLGSNVNIYSSTPTVVAEGSINGYTMTINEIQSGSFAVGTKIGGVGITANTVITAQTSGSAGSTGTYLLNNYSSVPPVYTTITSGNVVVPISPQPAPGAAIYGYGVTSSTGVSLSSLLQPGQSMTVTFMCSNGPSAYYITDFYIDSIKQNVNWLGASKPAQGTQNGIDVYTFTITRTYATQIVTPPTAIPVYTIIGQYSGYGQYVAPVQGGGVSVSTWSSTFGQSGTLYFKYGSTVIASLDTSGNWKTIGNMTGFATM